MTATLVGAKNIADGRQLQAARLTLASGLFLLPLARAFFPRMVKVHCIAVRGGRPQLPQAPGCRRPSSFFQRR